MTKLLPFLLMLITLRGISQVDTIYAADGRTIACKILKVKKESLKYKVYGEWDHWIDLTAVNHYVNNDENTVKPVKPKKNVIPYKSDTLNGLAAEVSRNTKNIEHIQYNLMRSHEQFNNGLLIMGAGVAVALFASLTEGDTQVALNGAAAAVGIVGFINVLASHRWINRAAIPVSGK